MSWPETDVLEPGLEPVDAISLLRADMDEVDGVFARYWDVSHDDDLQRRATKVDEAREACRRTRAYLELEQSFMRALQGTVTDPELLREMSAGQARAIALVEAIERVDPDDRQFDPSLRVLGDFLLKHAGREREAVFRHVVASPANLFEIGARLRREHAARRRPA